MKRFILNTKPVQIHIPLCALCHNGGMLAHGNCAVGDETWCTPCSEANAGMCERCGNDFDNDDLSHGDDREYCCYECAQYDDINESLNPGGLEGEGAK